MLQTQEGSYEAETAGRFFLRFCLPFLSRHLPSPRYRRKRKRAEVASAQARKKFCKSRQDDTAGKSSRERQAPALYAAVRVRHRSYGVSRILDPSPGGSQDTGGAFRSRVQRPGVRHRSIGAGHLCPMWQRTDLVQVKRDRHTGRPRKTHSTKAFRLRQSISFAEIRRKWLSLPTGEVRPSEHDYDYKELFLYDHKRHLPHPRHPVGQAGAA